MKYLQVDSFSILTSMMENKSIENNGIVIDGKIEGFSCKPVKSDKETMKFLKERFTNETLENFNTTHEDVACILEKNKNALLRNFSFLIEVLNLSFVDYDFRFFEKALFNYLINT